MIDVKDVRIAVVQREGDADWAKTGRYLSLRKIRDNNQLNPGPDFPIHIEGMSDAAIEQFMHHCIIAVCGEWPAADTATKAA